MCRNKKLKPFGVGCYRIFFAVISDKVSGYALKVRGCWRDLTVETCIEILISFLPEIRYQHTRYSLNIRKPQISVAIWLPPEQANYSETQFVNVNGYTKSSNLTNFKHISWGQSFPNYPINGYSTVGKDFYSRRVDHFISLVYSKCLFLVVVINFIDLPEFVNYFFYFYHTLRSNIQINAMELTEFRNTFSFVLQIEIKVYLDMVDWAYQ